MRLLVRILFLLVLIALVGTVGGGILFYKPWHGHGPRVSVSAGGNG